ncbi:MAG: hypothetical protein U0350_45255 [Caldilineaceae bacterium]
MFTVALIGPDGAGKTTITRRLQRELALPMKYVYLGINLETSNLVLPTTRLILELKRARGGRPDMAGPRNLDGKPLPKNIVKRAAVEFKAALRMTNQMAEEWFRQTVVWYYLQRGNIVLFDRHFLLDYYYYDVVPSGARPLGNRVHGFVLNHFYPRPDLVICLDAPAEVLFARKGEGTLESIERRRQEYLRLKNLVEKFVTVDASQPEAKVLQDVSEIIQAFYATRLTSAEKVLQS